VTTRVVSPAYPEEGEHLTRTLTPFQGEEDLTNDDDGAKWQELAERETHLKPSLMKCNTKLSWLKELDL